MSSGYIVTKLGPDQSTDFSLYRQFSLGATWYIRYQEEKCPPWETFYNIPPSHSSSLNCVGLLYLPEYHAIFLHITFKTQLRYLGALG